MQIDVQKNEVPQTFILKPHMLLGLIGEHCSQLIGVTNWRTVVILRRRTEARQELFSAQFALKLSSLLGRISIREGMRSF